MLNRKSAPAIHDITRLILPRPQQITLDNGIPLYVLDYPGQEIVKIEVVYKAGRPEENKRLTSRATARLVREGSGKRPGGELAELIDYYGGSISVPTSLDTSGFVLYALKKYASQLIPLLAEILLDPVFPEKELDTFRRTSMQELMVDLEKVEVLAYRKVTELIFGENHPYGYNSQPADYENLQRSDLLAFYQKWYTPANCTIFASGHIDDEVRSLLNQYFGAQKMQGQKYDYQSVVETGAPALLNIPRPDALQNAIKIGRRLFHRRHPDYNGMFVLNTILGGYFGSRLMMNIREKRGYTYNIYSTADAMLYDGCLYIATEVSPGKTSAAIREIFREMKRLREAPPAEEELQMVRNYLLGMLLNGLDGPLNTSDVVRSLIVEGVSPEGFTQMVETIRNISPQNLQELAEKYLRPEDFWVVTAGK